MHIPKGKPIHENLKTSYLNTTALLADLQISGFTGYLQAIFPYTKGGIFLVDGKILNAIDESPERARRGEEAIDTILLRASSPDGKISVYSHSNKIIEAIAGRVEGEILYQSLESDFTDLKKLVEKLKQNIEARFYVEVEFSEFGDGVIYIIDGTVEGVLSLATGEVVEGQTAYDRILSLISEKAAIFHVYRCAKLSITETPDNVLSFPEVTSPPVTNLPKLANKEVIVSEITEDIDQDKVGLEEHQGPKEIENIAVIEEVSELHSEAIVEAPVEIQETEDIDEDSNYDNLLGIMTEIIQIVERVSALVSKEANFTSAFRAGLLKVTTEYPVFDPFTDDFSYQEGKISLAAKIAPEVLIDGLTKVLKHTLDEMASNSPNSQVKERIAGALLRLEQLKQQEFESLGVSSALAEIIRMD